MARVDYTRKPLKGINMLTRAFIGGFRRLCSRSGSVAGGHKKSLILGIETSCDDTAMAIVNEEGTVLGEAHHSQLSTHIAMGGIIPPLAKSLHLQHIAAVHREALQAASIHPSELDAVAITTRPGLGLSLQVGLNHAKEFCREYSLPMIAVHHMEAHALVVRSCTPEVTFPFLVLLVSGGHCQIAVARDVSDFVLLGESIDDAPGEAFDKIARRLKINNMEEFRGVSGGAAIERLAKQGDPMSIQIPPPMTRHPNCDFSFSGLKTSIKRTIARHEKQCGIEGDALLPNIPDFCASFQHSVYVHIMKRLQRAFTFCKRKDLPFGNRLVVSGGVACSLYLRLILEQLCEHYEVELFAPPPKLCSDNGIMIAWNGMEHLKNGGVLIPPEDLDAVEYSPRCSLGQDRRDEVAKEWILAEKFKLDMDRLMKLSGNVKWQHKSAVNLA